jgi:glycosyltransferase involved in cell wall biosynthesis
MQESDVRAKLKIIYFSYFPAQHGIGPATAIRNLSRRFESKYDVTIITLNFDYVPQAKIFADDLHEVKDGQIRILYLPRGLQGIKKLIDEMKTENTCVVVNCMFDATLAIPAILHSLFRRQPVIHVPHGSFLPAVFTQKRLKERVFCGLFNVLQPSNSVVHIATSAREVKDIQNALKNPAIVQISNLNELREESAAEGKSPARLNICFIGRLAKQKNLLGALEILRFANVACQMDVFGLKEDGTYFEQCKTLIATLPDSIKVSFQGFTAQNVLLSRMGAYDLLFAPTLDENFGYSIIESLGAGVPVLISDRTPWHDLEQFNAGWVVELQNWARFGEILRLAYDAGEEWAAYRKGARAYAQAHTAEPGAAEKYEMLFEAILQCRDQPLKLPPNLICTEQIQPVRER